MPKNAVKIERFEGGINTHLHKKDIPENSFEVADNVMFDTIGKVRPGGYSEELGVDNVTIEAESGYGLFSFSHDFSNPNTATELTDNSNFNTAVDETFVGSNANAKLWKAVTASGTDNEWHYENADTTDELTDNPSSDGTDNGWYFDDGNNRMVCDRGSSATGGFTCYQKVGKPGRAYLIKVTLEFRDHNNANNKIFFYGQGGYSLSTGITNGVGYGKSLAANDSDTSYETADTSHYDIMVLPENTNGNIGLIANAHADVSVQVENLEIYEVPSPKDTSYLLTQKERYINLLDTSLTTWREDLLAMHSSALEKVKPQYYIADGVLRAYNANFGEVCENKWYGFIERQNFLDTTIASVDGSITGTSSSGAFIRQWVEEDQKIYAPSASSHTGDGDGKPGKFSYIDHGDNGTGASASTDGIKIHIARAEIADATCDGSYTFYLSYLYDDSEQESALTEIGTDTGDESDSYFIGVTVDYNNSNGYAFNKRITGGRLYYSDSTDSEGFKYHLLDIDFVEGCRKFDDVDFKPWNTETAGSVVECPSGMIGATVSDGATQFFQFDQMPKVTTYDMINGYSPDEDIYFRYKTATIAMDKLWVGNIGEVDSNGAITNRFSDRIIVSPRGRFDVLPRENFLDVIINDGDEIIKLESLADRLLVFKKKMLFIINIGKDGSEYIESEHKFLGVSHPASVIKTEGGVGWVNKRGAFVFDGRSLVNLIDNKIGLSDWRNYISKNPLIGFIPSRKQLFIIKDSNAVLDTSFYVYDFQTKSWTRNVSGMGSNHKTNIINIEDSTESYDGSPVYGTTSQSATDEQIQVHQAYQYLEDTTQIGHSAVTSGVDPDALAVQDGTVGAPSRTGLFFGFSDGDAFYSSIDGVDSTTKIKFMYGTTAQLADGGSGSGATNLTGEMFIRHFAGTTQEQAARQISLNINAHTSTSGYTAEYSGNSVAMTKNANNTTDNGKIIRWLHNSSGSFVVQASSMQTIGMSSISGGITPVTHVVQVAVHGVASASGNNYGFGITKYNQDSWMQDEIPTTEGETITIQHQGNTNTNSYEGGSTGNDDNNEKVAIDLRALANGNSTLINDFGITVSGVADSSVADETDGNDNIHFFSLSSATPFKITSNPVTSNYMIRKFTNENPLNVSGYKLITKEFDFGYPSVNKKIYKVYVTFRSVDKDGSYSDSGVRVYYGVDGKDITKTGVGSTFDTSKSKYYSSVGGLTAFDASSDLNTTLNDSGGISDSDTTIGLTDSSNVHKTGAIQIDNEQILIGTEDIGDTTANTITGNSDNIYRGYYTTSPASHSDGADVLVARTDKYVTAELKPSSSINNIKSFQLKFEDVFGVPAKFEINDITIVYRAKNIK